MQVDRQKMLDRLSLLNLVQLYKEIKKLTMMHTAKPSSNKYNNKQH